jgi:hypothetical protein
MVDHEKIIQSITFLQKQCIFLCIKDVKMPIASSLHEISRIIGPELSKEYMFAALDNILK